MAYLKGLNVSGSEVLQASQSIFTSVTASSFSGSFIGDGSGLSGVTVTGGVNLVGDQSITGSKSFQDQLNVNNTISGSVLDIANTATIKGGLVLTGSLSVDGSIDASGALTASAISLDNLKLTSLTTNTTSEQTLVLNGNIVEKRNMSVAAFDSAGVVSGSTQIL